jgi:hypothetical protein
MIAKNKLITLFKRCYFIFFVIGKGNIIKKIQAMFKNYLML